MENKHITVSNEQGQNINISVIGTFRIPDLEKEFMMYSMVDENKDNNLGAVLLGEVIRDGDNLEVIGVRDDERRMVVAFYNELSLQLGGE